MLDMREEKLVAFKAYLQEREYSCLTVAKYIRDVRALVRFNGEQIESKAQIIEFKDHLLQRGYAPTSINSMLASINSFLSFSGLCNWRIRLLKIQRTLFSGKDRELTQKEYTNMVNVAQKQGDERLAMVLRTICSTGIRVSELRAITVESLKKGQAQIHSKGKVRLILLPGQLCQMLRGYCQKRKIYTGMVFITKNGRPLDRSNLWKMMKRLAFAAKIQRQKVYPHNLRHLFACTYYKKYRDIVRLADIMGHSSINTTRIYTVKNASEQKQQLGQLPLLLVECTT